MIVQYVLVHALPRYVWCDLYCLRSALSMSLQGPSGLHEYRLRTLFEEVALPSSWPVLVNFHEAKAFATWKTSREEQVGSQYSVRCSSICAANDCALLPSGLFSVSFARQGALNLYCRWINVAAVSSR